MIDRRGAWAVRQLLVAALGVLAWVNLFSEYGRFPESPFAAIGGVAILIGVVLLGSGAELRRWRLSRRKGGL